MSQRFVAKSTTEAVFFPRCPIALSVTWEWCCVPFSSWNVVHVCLPLKLHLTSLLPILSPSRICVVVLTE